MNWIYTKDKEPDYYKDVAIYLIDGSMLDKWHRLSDGDKTYYGSLHTDVIIMAEDVVKWME